MQKLRILILIITLLVVGGGAYVISYFARGYRIDTDKLALSPNGLLVVKSDPDGAQIYIDGEFKTATNATIHLAPGDYDVSIKKEGYKDWANRLHIEKEVVTETTAHLFRSAPSLSPVNFDATLSPIPSRDMTKIAYIIPQTPGVSKKDDKSGLWVIEMLNLPLGFSRDPRRITDGDLKDAEIIWSPDGREILISTKQFSYLLNTGVFTPETNRVNTSSTKTEILDKWNKEIEVRTQAQLSKLPEEMESILTHKAESISFSPDEDMILYTASQSAKINDNLIKELPGSSTQKQERDIKQGKTYIYDIKEDRNFLIDDKGPSIITGGYSTLVQKRISWMPTSRHILIAEPNKITIFDYDGTNRQEIYSGNYVSPFAFPTLSTDRILILTNLGANSNPTNLYSIIIK